jgi:hypothetical protein
MQNVLTDNVPDPSPDIDGLINPVCYEHVGIQRKFGTMLDQMVTLLGSSCDELALAAMHYRQSDDDSAARIDNTYPAVPRPQPPTD